MSALLLSAGTTAVDQRYLLEARQMQALSLAVHIPLVCFGIAFPALVLYVESLYLRTGDPLYRTLAMRWSRIMITLFAVGVVTGTILSFEFGLLWPGFMSAFGNVFGLGFAFEGFSFFLEAIFIAIYVYGWDRISSRLHVLCGVVVVITGITGSLTVIAVNGWMNHPTGFDLVDGRAVNVEPWSALFGNSYFWHELVHMYLAGYMVTGFVLASVYAWGMLRGRWDRYQRTALAIPLAVAAVAAPVQVIVGDWVARDVGKQQPAKLAAVEGLAETTEGAPIHLLGWFDGERCGTASRSRVCSRCSPNTIRTRRSRGSTLCRRGQAAVRAINVTRFAFQTMVGIGTALMMLGLVFAYVRIRKKRLPESRWFYRAVVVAGPASLVALVAGWVVTEVGRQPWVVYEVMRTSEAVTAGGGVRIAFATLIVVYGGARGRRSLGAPAPARAPLGPVEPGGADVAR